MQLEFKIGLDKTDSLNYPDFKPEEIDIFLNKAIEKFVNQRAYGTNAKGLGLEQNQKRVDDLVTLISNSEILPTLPLNPTELKPNGSRIVLPSDYLHAIEEEAEIIYIDCNNVTATSRVPVYPIMHDEYNKIIRDPFNKPDETNVIRLGLNGYFEAITGTGVTLATYYLRYIRKAATVRYGTAYVLPVTDVQCDLPDGVHKEIIAISILDALGNIEQNNRIQTESIQVATQE